MVGNDARLARAYLKIGPGVHKSKLMHTALHLHYFMSSFREPNLMKTSRNLFLLFVSHHYSRQLQIRFFENEI